MIIIIYNQITNIIINNYIDNDIFIAIIIVATKMYTFYRQTFVHNARAKWIERCK